MTDVQFLSLVTGWPVNISERRPITLRKTLTAWGKFEGKGLAIDHTDGGRARVNRTYSRSQSRAESFRTAT